MIHKGTKDAVLENTVKVNQFTWRLTINYYTLPGNSLPIFVRTEYSYRFLSHENPIYICLSVIYHYSCFLIAGYTLYYGLLLPIGLILLHNLISFVIITHRLLKNTIPNPDEPERIDFKRQFQNGCLITILMLLTWVSGFLAVELLPKNFAISLIFCVCNGLQGICVLFFCIRQTDVYKCCKCCSCKIKRRESTGGKWTPGTLHKNVTYFPD